ncbi:MAG: acyl-CoA carboxylase subunit beta [Deltaproteobacteria bacterium]|nr:MAG: acyl-CoA carboxylase subunit beta [Deltaproteobacteria bacterium]
MSVIRSGVRRDSEEFRKNREEMLSLIDEVRRIEASVRETEERSRPKFEKRGQLLPRERLALLLDRGAPFLELSSLAGYRMYDDRDGTTAGGGIITGIGYVSGVKCLILCHNSAIKGGTISPAGLKKTLRAQEIAMENCLPVVFLVESGGANLEYQAEVFVEGGRVFANQARTSAMGIPQVAVVHGNSTAGGAYLPGLSDYVIMVRGRAKVFLAGPPLLYAATGEVATDEELGGAEMHARVAGTAEYLAEDDREGIILARKVIESLSWEKMGESVIPEDSDPPLYEPDELAGAVPVSFRVPYDVREILARILDGSRFFEFKGEFDAWTVCGFGKIMGIPCGIIGNNGPITEKGSVKAAQFIQLCCQSRTPIVYLQNTTGYMVGTAAEQGGIIKHGSKMIQAVANATVPQVTVIVGGSFGAGNYGMCGRALSPRFIFAWPNSRIGVMGSEQAAKVMSIITRSKWEREGKPVDEEALRKLEEKIVARMEPETTALFATARLWDDGIIDPRDTRKVLAFVLATCLEGEKRKLQPVTFGVARM